MRKVNLKNLIDACIEAEMNEEFGFFRNCKVNEDKLKDIHVMCHVADRMADECDAVSYSVRIDNDTRNIVIGVECEEIKKAGVHSAFNTMCGIALDAHISMSYDGYAEKDTLTAEFTFPGVFED